MEVNVTGPQRGSVIVGIDGSKPAYRAALWAAEEASRRGTALHLVHGADTDSRALYASVETIERVRRTGRELLDDTARAVTERHPGLRVTKEFSRSGPVPSLHRAAARYGTIVVGSRGLGGFNSLMLGSVGLKVAAEATTPVIVVRGAEGQADTGVVLVGVRDEHDLDCALYGAREAELRKASLRLLHVWNVLQSVGSVVTMLDDIEDIAGEHERSLTAVAEEVRHEFPDLHVEADAAKSMSASGVLVEASRHADLLVMGGRRKPGYIGRTLGRATHNLVHHAECPVLLIPRNGTKNGGES
ncbi:universal stress protein [Streptomyces longhuiensis]|uniref:universal stress protein n=1 Tax=Streptomyces longhuiensis TaxID=2880933 RepID=UPI001D0A57A7|nr:universal stress protein [Streptomyces longhuiensis]UDL97463.1 universal stress protein [Streptomyces longhuiensis]